MSLPDKNDPLANPAFCGQGFIQGLFEALFGFSRPLLCAQVEVSSFCMGRCSYCPRGSQAQSWRARHMKPETFARLWPLLKLCGQAHLQGWGEPLLNPLFFDMAALAKKAGCRVSTTSCGLVMNEETADRLAGGDIDLIAFSLAGTDPQSNQSRAGVDFNKALNNIKFLKKRASERKSALRVHLAYILLGNQIDALRGLPALMEDLDAEAAVISTLDYLARPEDREIAFLPEDSDKIERAREILNKISEEAAALGRRIHFALPSGKAAVHENGCRENVRKTIYIDADGNVSPCVYLNVPGSDPPEKRRVFGNVLTEKPLDIWKKEAFSSFRKALVNGAPDSVCLSCPKRLEIMEADGLEDQG